jgi:solute carrier family 25 2-oxodicarboxylate transporter 21
MHPLDLIKTRLQLQIKSANIATQTSNHHYYNGVFDCARKMIRSEGMFSLYKGILPPIMVETPKRAVKFLTFEQLKKPFMFGSDKPTPLVIKKAAILMNRFIEQIVQNFPFIHSFNVRHFHLPVSVPECSKRF